ncbi:MULTISPECIES: helix-turn-helix transcriptional regulator [unclassified Enterococcus]|uniref:helix-turn-helix domain-containing protein n=1 Tax=unclassified Enterococcus TaxID=2608891 RepID=UPI0015521F65|nr:MULTISPECIES: helix-turn-helix transcriptional regulator [unclassified Enterococcus]MBS7577627.1 helix-turn-helix domain-containing protein [Enterococcus sp. MMGLQ5-2]MBS7584179.1 helix-turn-helix domain-containing protein [Enterococcus sp. MMGLQ5-1]NPD12037.1 helix-turn-helix domain-containing protein [Enterococcus sp. MMGLQ5-1]NPD37460.1 helix-turn-helix domain-containing protein [Enterococcus sp. MMGLQ5-2]
MNTKEIIKTLAGQKGLTLAELERKLGISNGTIGKWNLRKPNSEPLEKVADYFNTTTDYLLGRTDNPYKPLPASEDFDEWNDEEEEIRIIQRAAKKMSDEDRKKAIDLWKVAFDKAFEDERKD